MSETNKGKGKRAPESFDANPAHHIPKLDRAVPAAADEEVPIRIPDSVKHARLVAGENLDFLFTCHSQRTFKSHVDKMTAKRKQNARFSKSSFSE